MNIAQLHKEVNYTATTSSGPGGQHVNKVATRVILEWNARESAAFEATAHELVLKNLQNKLTTDGRLLVACQESRSQAANKELVFKKLLDLLQTASTPKKKRLKRTTPAAVKRKRLNDKKKHSDKKADRRFRL